VTSYVSVTRIDRGRRISFVRLAFAAVSGAIAGSLCSTVLGAEGAPPAAASAASVPASSVNNDDSRSKTTPSSTRLAALQEEPAISTAPLTYRTMIAREAKLVDLPPEIAEAVMAVESGYNPAVVGSSGEIGLMQVLPSTARMMGFSGTFEELAVPAVNIHYGVSYLGQAWHLAGRDICTAVMKYRAGHGETRFSQLSVDYCLKVRARLMARGYPVSGAVPLATFGGPSTFGGRAMSIGSSVVCRRRCFGGTQSGLNFAALNKQLNSLAMQARGLHQN
jgi:soluble lytic murein transglycosylase-like protein